jgi:hypothetical protein
MVGSSFLGRLHDVDRPATTQANLRKAPDCAWNGGHVRLHRDFRHYFMGHGSQGSAEGIGWRDQPGCYNRKRHFPYGRVSTDGQSLSAQLAELNAAKCARIFQEKNKRRSFQPETIGPLDVRPRQRGCAKVIPKRDRNQH